MGSNWYNKVLADVAELVDAQDSGSCGATRGGSSPLIRTKFTGSFLLSRLRFPVFQVPAYRQSFVDQRFHIFFLVLF